MQLQSVEGWSQKTIRAEAAGGWPGTSLSCEVSRALCMVSSSGLGWASLHHGGLRMINYYKVIQGSSVTVPMNLVADMLPFFS